MTRFRIFVAVLLSAVFLGQGLAGRTWTDQEGRTIQATLLALDGETVWLLRDDGQRFGFPITRLSAADQEFARRSLRVPVAGLASGKPIPLAGAAAGPLISREPLGAAMLEGDGRASLFVWRSRSHGFAGGAHLYRWKNLREDGSPVFAHEARVTVGKSGSVPRSATVYQGRSGIYGFWLQDGNLIRMRLDENRLRFDPIGEPIPIQVEGGEARQVAVREKPNGRVSVIFGVEDGGSMRPSDISNWRNPRYRPFDGAGIFRGEWAHGFLAEMELAAIDGSPTSGPKPFSASRREVLISHSRIAPVDWGRGDGEWITGSWLGNLYGYGSDGHSRTLVADETGTAVRHPSLRAAPVAYPNSGGKWSDLIVGGEGGLVWHRFMERFLPNGAPVCAEAGIVLEEEAMLYPGPLPVLNVVDWNGDGHPDIVSGNAQGQILFFENTGSAAAPTFLPGVPLAAGGRKIWVQQGYSALQGPQEARWGYSCPTVFDWNGDGLPDILFSDATARHQVFMNRGARSAPKLDRGRPIYLDGLDLHGTWRVQPGVAKLGSGTAYVALDGDDQFHLYWRIDDFNVSGGGKLRLTDGSPIGANFLAAGGTGRLKIVLADWDQDGATDLIVGTPRHGSVPHPETGLPQSKGLPGASVLWLRNEGSDEEPVFAFPKILQFRGEPIYFGQHACSPAVGDLGGPGGPHLFVANERGEVFYFERNDVSWGE